MKTSNRKRQSRSRKRGRQRRNGQTLKLAALGAMGAVALGGGGYAVMHLAGQERIDASFCYARSDQYEVAFLLEASFTNQSSHQQQRDYETALRRAYDEAPANARISVFTTTRNVHGSLMDPVFTMCRPPATPEEQDSIGAPPDTPQRLALRAEEAANRYNELAAGVLRDARDENLSAQYSPILASLQAISRSQYFNSPNRILWPLTDGIENDPSGGGRFCAVRNAMPAYEVFAEQARFERVRPRPFTGAHINFLMVESMTLPQPGLEWCDHDEIRRFYTDYFEANGAASVELTTLRFGAE